jgi:hypothetical protein
VLAPSVDPVATFITVADSVSRAQGDAGLSIFVSDNSILVGAAVAKLLDVAFLTAQAATNPPRRRTSPSRRRSPPRTKPTVAPPLPAV